MYINRVKCVITQAHPLLQGLMLGGLAWRQWMLLNLRCMRNKNYIIRRQCHDSKQDINKPFIEGMNAEAEACHSFLSLSK